MISGGEGWGGVDTQTTFPQSFLPDAGDERIVALPLRLHNKVWLAMDNLDILNFIPNLGVRSHLVNHFGWESAFALLSHFLFLDQR